MTANLMSRRTLNQIERADVLDSVKSSSPFTDKQQFFHGNNGQPTTNFEVSLRPGDVYATRTPNHRLLAHVGESLAGQINDKVVDYVSESCTHSSGDTVTNKLINLRTNLTEHFLYNRSGKPHEGVPATQLPPLQDNILIISAKNALKISIGRNIELKQEESTLYVGCSIDVQHDKSAPIYYVDLDKTSKAWDTYKNEWVDTE